jgi:formiminotetrahydrofolate cyclodeaminase
MKLTQQTVSDFLAAVRDSRPTPGGGSAAAVAGALGASLLAMVASMPKHRAASEEDVERLQAAASRCRSLAERLEHLVDGDSAAYDGVVAAYKLPKGSEEEKAERKRRIQHALQAAIEAPQEVMRQCGDAIEAASTVARFGNPNAASDVGVALELLVAAERGARLNVLINLASVDDKEAVERLGATARTLAAECRTGAEAARALLDASA